MRRGLAIVTAGVASLAAGCGGGDDRAETDRILQALRAQTEAFRVRDVRTWCRKTFLSTDMPPALAERLRVPPGGGAAPNAWEQHYAMCVRDFGKHGEFGGVAIKPPPDLRSLRRLLKVRLRPGMGRISRTAKVTGPQRPEVPEERSSSTAATGRSSSR